MHAIRWLLLASAVLSFTACGGGSNKPKPDSGDDGPKPQCSDGLDNDSDGKIDFPYDPGCYSPNQNDETDDCPDGSDCPQCSNGMDDDGNGKTDYPDDSGCSSAADNDEYPSNPLACGTSVHILALPLAGDATGNLMASTSSNLMSATCGGAGVEDVYELRIEKPSVVVASTENPGTSADTVLYIRGMQCSDPNSEVSCDDNVSTTDHRSSLTQSIATPGTYYVVVDDKSGQGGSYDLSVALYPGEGQPCTADECGPGLVCRVPMGQTDKVCSKPVCSDSVDDDGDGKNDYPDDPGCQAPDDNDETDDCPTGPNCPRCSNGSDDDHDTHTDFPADTTCPAAASNGEVCTSVDPVLEIFSATTMGDTTNATDDYKASCAYDTGGKDLTYELTLPKMTSFTYSVADPSDNFFPETAMLGTTCAGTELACQSFDPVTVGPLAAGTYFLVVDGDDAYSYGSFVITVSGTIAGGQSCESPLAQSGAFTCAAGYACSGTPGSRTCAPTQCNDGIDNNGDGTTDYPNDPGCASASDTMEDTVCPGASCPVCSNGSDDDTDMKTDFPADFGCSSAAGTSEVFCAMETDPVVAITAAVTTGTLANLHADLTLSCNSFSDGNDTTYVLQLPVPVESLTLDTTGSTIPDTILQLQDTQCATSIACNDDIGTGTLPYLSSITASGLAAGNYAVTVKAYTSATTPLGPFKLNTHGTVAKGVACTGPLFTANVLKCETGSTCNATTHKCQ
jgi:hypothetical protein